MKAPNGTCWTVRGWVNLSATAAIVGVGIGIGLWFAVSGIPDRSDQGVQVDAAYRDLLPEGTWSVRDRLYEKRQVFTDGVERYRFDGADQALVDALVGRYRLTPADRIRESLFPAPAWWSPPDDGVTYVRGEGHQYVMLVYDPTSTRVFFEATQD
jgi:hypothetical protein